MKRFRFYTIVLISFLAVQMGNAQTDSYIQLKDPTGLGPSVGEKEELKRAADSLIAAFPLAYRDSFKVIEGAVYPLFSNTANGLNESLASIKTTASLRSKYHLLMVRTYNNTGNVKIIWHLVLPKGQPYDCIDDVKKQLFFGEMTGIVNKSAFDYDNIVSAIKSLRDKFDIFLGTNFREGCVFCPKSALSIENILADTGFRGRKVTSVTVNSENSGIENNFKFNKKVTVFDPAIGNSDGLDIYLDQKGYHLSLDSVMSNIYSNFIYYNTTSENGCSELYDFLEEQTPNSISTNGHSNRNATSEYLYGMDIIIIDGEENERSLYVRESSNVVGDVSNELPKVHLVFLGNNPYNLNYSLIKDSVKYFFNLIDINITTKNYYSPSSESKLSLDKIKTKDAISIIGENGSKILKFAYHNYISLISAKFTKNYPLQFFRGYITQPNGFITDILNCEAGDAEGGKLSIVKTNIPPAYLDAFACEGNRSKFVSYLVFHACGHNAGIVHDNTSDGIDKGFVEGHAWMMGGICAGSLCRPTPHNLAGCYSKLIWDTKAYSKSVALNLPFKYYKTLGAMIKIENSTPRTPDMERQYNKIKSRFTND